MAQPTNCMVPIGGVCRPSAQLISIRLPIRTGSMPKLAAMGRKMIQGSLFTLFINSPGF
jgi:hypothetical protein